MSLRHIHISIAILLLCNVVGCSREPTADPPVEPAYNGDQLVGFRINQVVPDSLLAEAGVKPGDVILSVNGIAVDSDTGGSDILSSVAEQETVTLRIRSPDGSERETIVSLPK